MTPTRKIKVGIIGGTGLDSKDILESRREVSVKTPYGDPSAPLICGTVDGVECILLSRHGPGHSISPSNINYRANICALKQEGCTHVIVTTACGSLKESIAPGHFVILDQFIDRTNKRESTFFDQKPGCWEGVCHIPMAKPFCPHLREILIDACQKVGVNYHPTGTTVTIEGPRFSTYAESMLFRSWGADLVNMTSVPEVVLAKEAGLMYAAVAMATDYDCWKENEGGVDVEKVLETFRSNAATALQVLRVAVAMIRDKGDWTSEIEDAENLVKTAMM